MERNRPHLIVNGLGQAVAFQAKGGGQTKRPSDVPNRRAHAQALLRAIDEIGDPTAQDRPGVYLEIRSRPNEPFVTKSLDASGLRLLKVASDPENEAAPARATVFASPAGVSNLRKKVQAFQDENTKKDRPKNADLVQSISAIVEAGLRALWRSPHARFPLKARSIPGRFGWNETKPANFLSMRRLSGSTSMPIVCSSPRTLSSSVMAPMSRSPRLFAILEQ
jgi:hypothetical protein